jgi:BirA family transcriptional regulator, biotin operon repressor / biotin---[acetyl-CoA-carboxylase] ligase
VNPCPLDIDQVRDGLVGNRLGSRFHYFRQIDSTNSHARQLAADGAFEGEIVVAEEQTSGRGRLGRKWFSPPYVNLYLSVILRPSLPVSEAAQLTLMAAVALREAIGSYSCEAPVIKWPNDILIQGRKIAGVLIESSCTADSVEFVIIGIGINVNSRRDLMPESIRDRATSLLAINGAPVTREDLLRGLIQAIDRCYGILQERGFSAIAREWEAHFGLRGRTVKAEAGDHTFIGTAKGIDRDGALLVERENGKVERVIAGDVVPVET